MLYPVIFGPCSFPGNCQCEGYEAHLEQVDAGIRPGIVCPHPGAMLGSRTAAVGRSYDIERVRECQEAASRKATSKTKIVGETLGAAALLAMLTIGMFKAAAEPVLLPPPTIGDVFRGQSMWCQDRACNRLSSERPSLIPDW